MSGTVKISSRLLGDDGRIVKGVIAAIPAHISGYTEAYGMTPALGNPSGQTPVIQTGLPNMPAFASWPAGVYTDAPQDCWPPSRLYWTPDKARQAADYLRTAFIPTIRMLAGQPDLPYPQARLYAELTAQARKTASAYVRYANATDFMPNDIRAVRKSLAAWRRAVNAAAACRALLGQPATAAAAPNFRTGQG